MRFFQDHRDLGRDAAFVAVESSCPEALVSFLFLFFWSSEVMVRIEDRKADRIVAIPFFLPAEAGGRISLVDRFSFRYQIPACPVAAGGGQVSLSIHGGVYRAMNFAFVAMK